MYSYVTVGKCQIARLRSADLILQIISVIIITGEFMAFVIGWNLVLEYVIGRRASLCLLVSSLSVH